MNQLPHVSIIILNWNGIDYTEQCLNSLQKINYPNYRVIVVDNDSMNNEALRLKDKFAQYIHLIENDENFGFAKGNNIGIDYAIKNNTEFICLLNNDTTVEKNFLSEMVTTSLNNHKIGMVAPHVLKMDNIQKIDNLGITLPLSGLPFNRKNSQQRLFCPSGGAALYSTAMLKKIAEGDNYFDKDYFAYAEDWDLGFRGLLAGYTAAYAPNAVVYHYGSASSKAMSDFHIFHNYRNIILTIIKNYPLNLLIKYTFWIILLQLAIFLLYIKRMRVGIILKAYGDVLKMLPKTLKKRKFIQNKIKVKYIDIAQYLEPTIVIKGYLSQALKN